MEKLNTIQKREKLNNVYGNEECSEYVVTSMDDTVIQEIIFQKGARDKKGSIPGVLDCDLLEIVRDRLRHFQQGEFACECNEQALKHIEYALFFLNERVEDRIRRNVLGKDIK